METKTSIWKGALSLGLVYGLVSIGISLIFYVTDLTFEVKLVMPVSLIVTLGMLFWGGLQYRNKILGGYISWGKAWQVAAVMSIYAAVLVTIYTYLLYTVIDPDLLEKQFAFTEKFMYDNFGNIPEDILEEQLKKAKETTTVFSNVRSSFFGSIGGGLVLGLISSIFVQKKGNPMENQE